MSSSILARTALLRPSVARSLVAGLQARASSSTSYPYVPGGPILKGTVNDPTTFPAPSKSHGSHHWAFERLLSAALVPLTAAAFVTTTSQYPVLDGALGLALVVHSHIGFEALRVDYLHERKFKFIGPATKWFIRLATLGAAAGVYSFNTNDIGISEFIANVWHA